MAHEVVQHYQHAGLLYGAVESANSGTTYMCLIKRNGWHGCTCAGWAYRDEPCSHLVALAEAGGATRILDRNIENEDTPTNTTE